ncbi:cytochrome P450 [Loktanella sp. SALINAS62]|uniref:cytochrome P450 n=1 Tax=Loktanella sp. SALINAS62 TaxID=2706124 RepID=UPI001B8AC875|nr:cytochrome P450 [Loktanella sp. SALINAS62]
MLTRTALRWCGIPVVDQDVTARSRELGAMFRNAGRLGPGYVKARALRARSERWALRIVRAARSRAPQDGADSVPDRLVLHRDADQSRLSDAAAVVELLNVLRPLVAVGVYITFAVHALHQNRARIADFIADGDRDRLALVGEEVRRLYPFFPMIGGRVMEPFTWHGARFDRSDWLLLDLYGTNRDPTIWPSPDTFDPARHIDRNPTQRQSMVPQGGGDYLQNHRCPGEHLTQVLLTEAIAQLVGMDYDVPPQDMGIPLNLFPPAPRDGMQIAVAR